MEIVSILKADHREVEALFTQMEAASERALKLKQKLFKQIQTALTVHALAEEKILYPRMRQLRDLEQSSFEANEEHRLVKQLLAEIDELEVGQEVWDAKVKVLMDLVRHHVEEEEGEYFKTLKSKLDKSELLEMGEALLAFKAAFQAPGKRAARSDSTAAELA